MVVGLNWQWVREREKAWRGLEGEIYHFFSRAPIDRLFDSQEEEHTQSIALDDDHIIFNLFLSFSHFTFLTFRFTFSCPTAEETN